MAKQFTGHCNGDGCGRPCKGKGRCRRQQKQKPVRKNGKPTQRARAC